MRRLQLPPVITDLFADPVALRALAAACLAIAAAGLDPHILDPNSVRVKAALASGPELEWLVSLGAVVQASLILVGGAVADLWRSVRLVRAALVGLVAISIALILAPDGPALIALRVAAWTCDGLIIPFAVGVVAQLYSGEVRGTAIGVLLAAYGAATFLAPIVVTIFGPTGPEAQGFILCAVVAVIAFRYTGRHLPALPGARPDQRITIVSTALWAIGLVLLADGLVQATGEMIIAGAVIVVLALAIRRILRAPASQGVRARASGAALMAGLVIGFSQAVPMGAIPLFFHAVQGVDTFLASLLILPFVIGLGASGLTAGLLLSRFSPRQLILGGVWLIALSNVAFVVLLGPATSYLAFIVPLALMGVGFMVSTAVRTAVIFASTPRRLAGTAGALNEASLGVGTRLGVTAVVLVQTGALGGATDTLGWLQTMFVAAAIVGIIGGLVVTILLGTLEPVRTMWDHRDEREAGDETRLATPGPAA